MAKKCRTKACQRENNPFFSLEMKLLKFPLIAFLALIFTLSVGCTSHQGGRTHTNAFGIYERETHAYTQVPSYNIPFRRADFDPDADISGNRTTLLWGLFTYYDY